MVLYDITNNSIRKRIANRLIAEGYERLQLSVYLGNKNLKNDKKLWPVFCQWIEKDNGKMAIMKLPPTVVQNIHLEGEQMIDFEYLLGQKFCMFV
ncbi:CRISPR-associated endonuclease Cas2 [Arcticibacterium luteifluviistationis]|nr:CRISPR-associated endonuclease Cas2 [Arcticibacterium luteifluviistationis]